VQRDLEFNRIISDLKKVIKDKLFLQDLYETMKDYEDVDLEDVKI
jgi:hypothetical protein